MKEVKVAINNFRQWVISPKNMAAILCLALYTYDLLHGMTGIARDFDTKVAPWTMPFLLSNATRFLPVIFLFLLLVSDSPLRTKQQLFVFLRTGKRAWIQGQLLYLFLISVGFTAIVWLLSWIWYLPYITWDTNWGPALITASQGIDLGRYGVFLKFNYRIMKNSSPISVTLWCACVMVLVCYMMGTIMILCNLWLRKGLGAAITSSLAAISLIPEFFIIDPGIIKKTIWISPVTWMDRNLMGYSNQGLPSYAFGILAPALISLGLSLFAIFTIGKCNVETDKE